MILSGIARSISDGVEAASASVSEALFEPVVRLGVTGLSRAGKTVFITALVHNLLNTGRMPQLRAAQAGGIQGVVLQPQPDLTLPRFAYEDHLAALLGAAPQWPQSTRAVSELRLSFRLRPSGLLGMVTGPRRLHLDIVDYPGEWLLDLALLGQEYGDWSAATLNRLERRAEAADYLRMAHALDPAAPLEEAKAQALAAAFTGYLQAAQAAGRADCTPGRFLLPGDLAGSPVLTFAPLPPAPDAPRASLIRQMARRYDGYREKVVRPFFQNHFARIDRQVVLIDLLDALHRGPEALEDLRRTMAEVLAAFRPGTNSWLGSLLRGRRVERLLFAATKADHLHHSQHAALSALAEGLLAQARDRARFSGAGTAAMAIAALRATVEEAHSHEGREVPMVRGTLGNGRQAAFHAGDLPAEPGQLLAAARQGAPAWLQRDYASMRFAPPKLALSPGEGVPHIRLDRAAEFLLGDKLV